ncbi:MAG: site-specific integrase [Planctomycetes bacterium]|nr:site-specific integrase [Planctomycetota bacterium]MCO5168900.1 site-specific integrase [Planctomycetota bacterium]
MASLSRWLDERRLAPGEFSSGRVLEFVAYRREGYSVFRSLRGVEPVIRFLRSTGAVPPADPPKADASPLGRLLRQYEAYLVRERELRLSTVNWYARVAREFLAPPGSATSLGLRRLKAADVTAFVLREARSISVAQVTLKVTALRSFLRYAFVEGLVPHDLALAVPAIAGWRLAGLPKALPADVPKRLLGSCDRRSPCGLRDYAVLLLLLRLGLRVGEVAASRLEDIDWQRGEVLVRGKGARRDRLPMPEDVGQAIVAYLQRGRPKTASRALFVRTRAPHVDLTAGAVKGIVTKAGRSLGMSPLGAHRLRHTAACEMLRRGASLPEIGQVLRHRAIDTTAIYAKVDRGSLRTLVRSWPGAAE